MLKMISLLGVRCSSLSSPQVGLVNRPAANAKVSHGLLKMGGEQLLPGLMIAHLVALREAVPVGIDPACLIGIVAHNALAVRLDVGVDADAVVNSVAKIGIG